MAKFDTSDVGCRALKESGVLIITIAGVGMTALVQTEVLQPVIVIAMGLF